MKLFYKRVLLITFLIIFCNIATQAMAADYITMNNHILNGGVGNYGYNDRYYFITATATDYTPDITNAMNTWIFTTSRLGITTPISYKRTYTQSSSVMDVYATYASFFPSSGSNGWTEFWRYSTSIDPMAQNWGWNKIYINTYNTNSNKMDGWHIQGVIAHEMGHCFGLDENNTRKDVVMCQAGSGRTVNASQPGDLKGINFLY